MSILKPITDQLKRYGMPVQFLESIDRCGLTVSLGSEDEFVRSLFSDTLRFSQQTLDGLRNPSPQLPYGETSAIQTLYHEGTHAYLHLRHKHATDRPGGVDPAVAQLVTQGTQYYRDAPLQGGGKASDPERIFQEAIAMYTGNRAAKWWEALEAIELLEGMVPKMSSMMFHQIALLQKTARETPQKYDHAMGRRVFGYQEKSFWSSAQIETSRAIPSSLKEYADRVLLEGKIPDSFSRTTYFSRYQQIAKRVLVQPGFSRGGGAY